MEMKVQSKHSGVARRTQLGRDLGRSGHETPQARRKAAKAFLGPPAKLWHPEVPGPLWNGTHCVRARQIKAYCQIVAREFRPLKIFLFGSYACGKPTRDSDVDLLVIMPFRGREVDQVVKIRSRVESPFPMDLIVKRPSEIKRRTIIDCCFTKEILTRGRVMYEAPHA